MKTADVVKHFGHPTLVAAALGIRRQAVLQWGKLVPELRAHQVERLTGGVLKMRPELYRKRPE